MRPWGKGFVWVNGHNLGRFWKIGPQQTLFLPGVWLKKGKNEVVVFDEGPTVANPTIAGLAEPVLDEVAVDLSQKHRKAGQSLKLDGLSPNVVTQLEPGSHLQGIVLPNVKGRYLCIEALSAIDGGPCVRFAIEQVGRSLKFYVPKAHGHTREIAWNAVAIGSMQPILKTADAR
jgi:beta-galactosidase